MVEWFLLTMCKEKTLIRSTSFFGRNHLPLCFLFRKENRQMSTLWLEMSRIVSSTTVTFSTYESVCLDGHFWNHLAKSKKNPEKNDLPVFIKEFAKLRAFGAHVPYMSKCLRVLNYYVSTCIRALIFHVPTCLRAYVPIYLFCA